MNFLKILTGILIALYLASVSQGAQEKNPGKKRLLVVDSYHREYRLSQETHRGFCEAMLRFGYLDNREQIDEYTKNDYVETSKAVVKKLWMDTKRKNLKEQMLKAAKEITEAAGKFKPDLIFLGEDDAVKYVGIHFLDSRVPVVFWGVNNNPTKYGLVDSIDKPGHNITGVYQSGYYADGLRLLKRIAPWIKTFAVLSDDSPPGRSHAKAISYLAGTGELPVKLTAIRITNNYEVWKRNALELQDKVDAFFIAQFSSLKDNAGKYVPINEVTAWYISHIRIPEATTFKFFVEEGMLCAADDEVFNQGFNAVVVAHDILEKGADPAVYPPVAPKRGALAVNKERAKILGIRLTENMGIEEFIESAKSLKGEKGNDK